MATPNDSRLSEAVVALTGSLTSARRALDVTALLISYDGTKPGALVEALSRAWDQGAEAGSADRSNRRSRRPQ